MTQRFILDENIVILAQKGENERGEKDPTCARLIESIIEICHTMVFDLNLWTKHHRQLSGLRVREPQLGIPVLALFSRARLRPGKLEFTSRNAPEFPEEDIIPQGSQDDRDIVRLAVECRAALVTTDAALRDDLNLCGVQEAYSLQLLSPAEALKIL